MIGAMAWHRGLAWGLGLVAACGPQVDAQDEGTGDDSTSTTAMTSTTALTTVTPPADDTADTSDDDPDPTDPPLPDFGLPGKCSGDACTVQLDLLVVVDNSAHTGAYQAILARELARLVDEPLLTNNGNLLDLDLQLMVTTTDMGNQLCTPFEPDGYDPAQGAPTITGCNARIAHFTGLSGTEVVPQVCTDICPSDVVASDSYIAVRPDGTDNVQDVAPVDIDGDGDLESPAAQAVACLVPQGVNGCGYESPLEAMLQALEPAAPWNSAANPFLRPDAALGVIIVTDEADCSIDDPSVMSDPQYQNVNPDIGMPAASSAICWNAGVQCDGPNGGIYENCTPVVDGPLQNTGRYTSYLEFLRDEQGKDVFMIGYVGVPSVTEHAADPPFEPTGGGAAGLVPRTWIDGQYPAGDILPSEFADGVDAADKEFAFGVGPGCTGAQPDGSFTGQAVPNHRVMEVCESLDTPALGDDGIRCAIESVCDGEYGGIRGFIHGLALVPGPIKD